MTERYIHIFLKKTASPFEKNKILNAKIIKNSNRFVFENKFPKGGATTSHRHHTSLPPLTTSSPLSRTDFFQT
jgi:hypothetical protein